MSLEARREQNIRNNLAVLQDLGIAPEQPKNQPPPKRAARQPTRGRRAPARTTRSQAAKKAATLPPNPTNNDNDDNNEDDADATNTDTNTKDPTEDKSTEPNPNTNANTDTRTTLNVPLRGRFANVNQRWFGHQDVDSSAATAQQLPPCLSCAFWHPVHGSGGRAVAEPEVSVAARTQWGLQWEGYPRVCVPTFLTTPSPAQPPKDIEERANPQMRLQQAICERFDALAVSMGIKVTHEWFDNLSLDVLMWCVSHSVQTLQERRVISQLKQKQRLQREKQRKRKQRRVAKHSKHHDPTQSPTRTKRRAKHHEFVMRWKRQRLELPPRTPKGQFTQVQEPPQTHEQQHQQGEQQQQQQDGAEGPGLVSVKVEGGQASVQVEGTQIDTQNPPQEQAMSWDV